MPLYEYACPDCELAFEMLQKMSDDVLKVCPFCSKKTLTKLFSVPHIQIESEPKTIGELAERNTKKMSKDELSEKTERKLEKRRQGLAETAAKVGGKAIKQSDTIPWWRDGKSFGSKYSEKPIDTTKISNIRRYVETGKT